MAINFPATPNDGDTHEGYVWVAAESAWRRLPEAPSMDIQNLNNVSVTTPADGESLVYSGTEWVNETLSLTSTIEDLTDTTISSPSEGDIMVYDGSSWINTPATSGNAVINGDFGIWQRGTEVSRGSTYGDYRADRWLVGAVDDGVAWRNMTVSRSTSAPANFEYSAKFTVLDATANRLDISQPFESGEYFANRPVTVSFYIRRIATFNSNVAVSILGSVILSDINTLSTTEFTRLSRTGSFSASTLENNGRNGGAPLIRISDLSQNEIVASAGDLVEITGVQLEAGSVATPFRLAGGGSKGAELALCQRYYQKSGNRPGLEWYPGIPDNADHDRVVAESMYGNADRAMTSITFPVRMRVSPTVSYYPARSAVSNTVSRLTVYNANTLVSFSSAAASGVSGIQGHFTGTSTDGTMYTYQYTADAEL